MQAGRLTPLTAYATSKSVIDETAYLFLAHDLLIAILMAGRHRNVMPGTSPRRGIEVLLESEGHSLVGAHRPPVVPCGREPGRIHRSPEGDDYGLVPLGLGRRGCRSCSLTQGSGPGSEADRACELLSMGSERREQLEALGQVRPLPGAGEQCCTVVV